MKATATVIYHSADFDGIFCREIAKKFLPLDTTFIGWNFGDPLIKVNAVNDHTTFILDLSPDCIDPLCLGGREMENIIWIDHHKTSIDKWSSRIKGYRIDGVAACRLAWQWFNCAHLLDAYDKSLPTKQDYVDRKVNEPVVVRLVGEYDIGDRRDPEAETLQYGLRCSEDEPDWGLLLSNCKGFRVLDRILSSGAIAQLYAQQTDASICKFKTWIMKWEGLNFLCVNSAKFNSRLFTARDIPETGHDALLGFCFTGKCWVVSLYHSKHRTDLDLSVIAKLHGGGGHRGACGFSCSNLPFTL